MTKALQRTSLNPVDANVMNKNKEREGRERVGKRERERETERGNWAHGGNNFSTGLHIIDAILSDVVLEVREHWVHPERDAVHQTKHQAQL